MRISCIDIISGDVYTFENCEEYFHNPITFDEVERFYSSYRPKELVIFITVLMIKSKILFHTPI